jgi:hypothetical protein
MSVIIAEIVRSVKNTDRPPIRGFPRPGGSKIVQSITIVGLAEKNRVSWQSLSARTQFISDI